MAVDTSILGQFANRAENRSITDPFNRGVKSAALFNKIQEDRELAPLRLQAAQQQALQRQQTLDQGQQTLQTNDRAIQAQNIQFLRSGVDQLQGLPMSQRPQALSLMADRLAGMGIDASQITQDQLTDEGLNAYRASLPVIPVAGARGIQQAQQVPGVGFITLSRDGQVALNQLPEADRVKVEAALAADSERKATEAGQKKRAILGAEEDIKPGIARKVAEQKGIGEAGAVVATAEDVGDAKAKIDAKKEAAILKQRFKLKPKVEAAVQSALAASKAESSNVAKGRSNKLAFDTYNIALSNLSDGLGLTWTGPLVGLMPAMTENQRIAEGSIALMPSLLKDVFRGAGEGTFTEGDQKILTDMIPTRRDGPKARTSKLNGIDAIIRSKLGQEQRAKPISQQVPTSIPRQEGGQQFTEGQTASNPNTGQRLIFRNGQWVEL